jgi:CRP-like cAMP-binding protein
MANGSVRTIAMLRADPRLANSLADTRLATFPFLTQEERAAMRDCPATRRPVRIGMELVREGDPVDTVYFLEDGWACQYTTTRDGRRQISALLLPGDICNLDALLFRQLDVGVRMLTHGSVLAVPRERVATLAANYPGIMQCFTWLGLSENTILSRRTLCLGRLSARERLAHLLCELAVRLGHVASEGPVTFAMPLTQEHIADVLGLTPVHVNRSFRQLRTEGLLSSTRGTIAVCDIMALRRAGEFQPGYLHVQELRNGSTIDLRDANRRETLHVFEGPR